MPVLSLFFTRFFSLAELKWTRATYLCFPWEFDIKLGKLLRGSTNRHRHLFLHLFFFASIICLSFPLEASWVFISSSHPRVHRKIFILSNLNSLRYTSLSNYKRKLPSIVKECCGSFIWELSLPGICNHNSSHDRNVVVAKQPLSGTAGFISFILIVH